MTVISLGEPEVIEESPYDIEERRIWDDLVLRMINDPSFDSAEMIIEWANDIITARRELFD